MTDEKRGGLRFAEIALNTPVNRTFTYRIPQEMQVEPGVRVVADFNRRKMTGYILSLHNDEPSGFDVKDIVSVIDDSPLFDERLTDLVRYVSDSYLSSIGEALSKALPSGESTRLKTRHIRRDNNVNNTISLTEEQQKIYSEIKNSESGIHLIFGITGSGKTEIYINAALDIIKSGRSVIYLVPEITLSSQIFDRLQKVFGDDLVLYHSGLTQNQRLANWKKFQRGEAKIAVGTRSSVFLQAPDLGLIIIDEEQDPSYKEQSSPRYNAKRIAYYRAIKEKAKLILGSATPSIETMYSAEKGSIRLHILNERYGGAKVPEIEVVKVRGGGDEISPRLKLYTNRAVKNGNQAVYLLNRRGFAPFVLCEDCGTAVECPHCSIGMNYHRNKGLLCHYCGYMSDVPETCSKCGSGSIVKLGSGTQKIEDIIQGEFPGYRIFRLDQDTARKKDTASLLIDKMKKREIDILLGTQMVSKGFDFHGVTVAGIILADIGLNMPDFRSTERIFSLLFQLAGRSGRGEENGRVIIQTLNETNPIYDYLKKHDYTGFYNSELNIRRMLDYPPFSRLARIVFRGKEESEVSAAASGLGSSIDDIIVSEKMQVAKLGPAQAPFARIGGNYRYHLILKGRRLEELQQLIRKSMEIYRSKSVYAEIDIDPVDML
ncbi:MAG TPA: primosomal protein N' [Spirochaetota bacterium]|nr:primosomal protein N' [Spirochaetota bacterium]HPJ41799.1 primosomal protein N' [Spirochaetota bacterium]HPR38101.1 primosomal protein N' [Spirochaetota bacterium]HRX46961.1 primosomal protein N' [Spirochaetota bacterium]